MKGGKVVAGLVAEPWPPVPQWELDAETPSSFLGQRGFLRYFTNAKGLRIAAYFWPSTRNDVSSRRGTIVAVHGHGAHLCFEYLKFVAAGRPHVYGGSWVQALNAAGYAVCGIDSQGCGRSEGLRCYVESFEDYVADVLQLVRLVTGGTLPGFESQLPPSQPAASGDGGSGSRFQGGDASPSAVHSQLPPLFLMGESKGGCVALVAALRLQQQQQQATGRGGGNAATNASGAHLTSVRMQQETDANSSSGFYVTAPSDAAAVGRRQWGNKEAAGASTTTAEAPWCPATSSDGGGGGGGGPIVEAYPDDTSVVRIDRNRNPAAGGSVTSGSGHPAGTAAVSVSGLILLAPMLSLQRLTRSGANRLLLPFVRLLSALRPALPIARTSSSVNLFPHLQEAWDADPMCYKGMTRARSAAEYLRITRQLIRGCAALETSSSTAAVAALLSGGIKALDDGDSVCSFSMKEAPLQQQQQQQQQQPPEAAAAAALSRPLGVSSGGVIRDGNNKHCSYRCNSDADGAIPSVMTAETAAAVAAAGAAAAAAGATSATQPAAESKAPTPAAAAAAAANGTAAISMRHVNTPLLVFHSERDTMCDPDGSKALLLAAAAPDKQLLLVNDMWHMLIKEPGNERILFRITSWLDERTPARPAQQVQR